MSDETQTAHTLRLVREEWEAPLRAEIERLQKVVGAARDKFAELDLPVYAEACDAALRGVPGETDR